MKVLVAGASGLVGGAAVTAFAEAGWDVVATSRRAPELPPHDSVVHRPLDLNDREACRAFAVELSDVTHVVYAAVHEMPGLVRGWRSPVQMETNRNMLANLLDPLVAGGRLQHITLLQGTKAYGVHHHPIRIPSRESEPRDPHDNFYWLQEDHVREHARANGLAWTIFRPPLVVGPAVGVAMNLPPVLGAYAAVRATEGLPFSYPGGPSYVAEAVDARIVALACVWAATHEVAHGEHFNITNGDVYEWRDLWPTVASALGVEAGTDETLRISAYLEERASLWDEIVRRHRLRPTTLAGLVGESHHYADFQFASGAASAPPPALMSTVKLRRAGFHHVMDTAESFTDAIATLQRRRILPPPD